MFSGATSLGGPFIVGGENTGAGDGTGVPAPFLGALSDSVNIDRAILTLLTSADNSFGFGVNRLLTTDAPLTSQAVPEPATLGLVGAGVLAALRRRRQRR